MTNKRAFRPASPDGHLQLESRQLLSHAPLVHPHHALHHAGGDALATLSIRHAARRHGPSGLHTLGTNTGRRPRGARFPKPPAPAPPAPAPPAPVLPAPPAPTLPVAPAPVQPPSVSGVPAASGAMTAAEQSIVDLVNQQRALAGLAPLQVDPRLVEAAHIQSIDMATVGVMDHTLSGVALPTLQSRAQYVGYNYSWLGENIAFNYPDPNSVMTGWMNSPPHRANILNPNYTQIGVGIAYDSGGNPYYTQEFGQPA